MVFDTVVSTLIALVCLVIIGAMRRMNKTDKTLAGIFITVYVAALVAIWL